MTGNVDLPPSAGEPINLGAASSAESATDTLDSTVSDIGARVLSAVENPAEQRSASLSTRVLTEPKVENELPEVTSENSKTVKEQPKLSNEESKAQVKSLPAVQRTKAALASVVDSGQLSGSLATILKADSAASIRTMLSGDIEQLIDTAEEVKVTAFKPLEGSADFFKGSTHIHFNKEGKTFKVVVPDAENEPIRLLFDASVANTPLPGAFKQLYAELEISGLTADGNPTVTERFATSESALEDNTKSIRNETRAILMAKEENIPGLPETHRLTLMRGSMTVDGKEKQTVVMEKSETRVKGGDLLQNGAEVKKWDIQKQLRYFWSGADTLAKLHAKKISNNDVKPDNFLIDDNGLAIMIDFGLASFDGEDPGKVGTLDRQPPEVIHPDDLSRGVDTFFFLVGKPGEEGAFAQFPDYYNPVTEDGEDSRFNDGYMAVGDALLDLGEKYGEAVDVALDLGSLNLPEFCENAKTLDAEMDRQFELVANNPSKETIAEFARVYKENETRLWNAVDSLTPNDTDSNDQKLHKLRSQKKLLDQIEMLGDNRNYYYGASRQVVQQELNSHANWDNLQTLKNDAYSYGSTMKHTLGKAGAAKEPFKTVIEGLMEPDPSKRKTMAWAEEKLAAGLNDESRKQLLDLNRKPTST